MKLKFLLFLLIGFLIAACDSNDRKEQGEKALAAPSTKSISEIVKQVSDALPLSDTTATAFFQSLDSTVIKKDEVNKKQQVNYKRYTFYYDTDSTTLNTVWMELNPDYELTMDELTKTFQNLQPAPSNSIDIQTEDAVVHKKYSYATSKGMVDLKIYSRYDKITGVLLEFKK